MVGALSIGPRARFVRTKIAGIVKQLTSLRGIGELLASAAPAFRSGAVRAVEGAMPRANLWSRSVPRVELDQRAREARLRLERISRRLAPRAAAYPRLRRLLCLFSAGIYRGASRETRTGGPLSDQRPSPMPALFRHLEPGQSRTPGAALCGARPVTTIKACEAARSGSRSLVNRGRRTAFWSPSRSGTGHWPRG